MIINRILGTLWLLLFCYYSFNTFWGAFTHGFHGPTRYWMLLVFFLCALITLIGVVASLYLIFGATWARWTIGVLSAFLMVSGCSCLCYSHNKKLLFAAKHIVTILFAIVSLVFLFLI